LRGRARGIEPSGGWISISLLERVERLLERVEHWANADERGSLERVYCLFVCLFVCLCPIGDPQGSHYGGDARTYMNIGEAMGTAMAKMLK
jgi:hypothetical protein